MSLKYADLVGQVNEIFARYDMALTLRQLFYRLVAKHTIPNTLNSYKGLSRMMVKAREAGDVDEDMIEDRSRGTIGGDDGCGSPDEYFDAWIAALRDSWTDYARSRWANQPCNVEVWVEKDALSRVMSEVAGEFKVRTCPSRGYSSYTYLKQAVKRFDSDKPTIILYFGDYDPSGLDICRDLKDRLTRYGAFNLEIKRMALSLDQIREFNLPPMPAKSNDSRYAKFVADTGGADAVELDALEPDVLQRLVREAIDTEIDHAPWEEIEEKEQVEREELRRRLERLEIKEAN